MEKPTLFYIDDSEIDLKIMQCYCTRLDISLITCLSGEDGLEIARKEKPAAILLDIHLRGLDGWDILQLAKKDGELCNIPIILVTAHQLLDTREKALAAGAVDVLLKPISARALTDIKNALLK